MSLRQQFRPTISTTGQSAAGHIELLVEFAGGERRYSVIKIAS
jgi:hypothetical protein